MSGECEKCSEHTVDCKCNLLQDAWTIDLRSAPVLEEEWDSNWDVGFWQPKLCNRDGKAIEIPSCPKCKCLMNMVIGKEAFAWICLECYEDPAD